MKLTYKLFRIVAALWLAIVSTIAFAGPLTTQPSLPLVNTNLPGYIHDCTLSNNASAATTAIDIGDAAPGVQRNAGCQATSNDQTTLMWQPSAYTKSISSTWAVGSGTAVGGLDVGAVLASTWYHVYEIERLDTGVTDYLLSQAPALSSTSLTCTSASPMVCTWNGGAALSFQNGAPFQFTAGTAPTGFSLNTTYFIVGSTQASGTFELATTQGGAAANSTSTGSGLTGTLNPVLPANYTVYRRIGSILTDASSHILAFTQVGNQFTWATSRVDASTSMTGTTLFVLSVPPGVVVTDQFRGNISFTSASVNVSIGPVAETAVSGVSAVVQVANQGSSFGNMQIATNLAQQIKVIPSTSGVSINIMSYGYIDPR